MGKYNFKVDLSPMEAFNKIKEGQNADLVHEEFFNLEDGKFTGTLIFEKYYFRAENRAALVVLIDNLKGYTDIRSIATGSSKGIIFNFDWGAGDSFAYSVKETLEDFIIE